MGMILQGSSKSKDTIKYLKTLDRFLIAFAILVLIRFIAYPIILFNIGLLLLETPIFQSIINTLATFLLLYQAVLEKNVLQVQILAYSLFFSVCSIIFTNVFKNNIPNWIVVFVSVDISITLFIYVFFTLYLKRECAWYYFKNIGVTIELQSK